MSVGRGALLALALASLLGACSAASTPLAATGIVIGAEGPSAAVVDTFTLRTAQGQMIDFRVGRLDLSNAGLPAPHLREHLVSGEQITVTYHVESGANVADRYVDVGQ